MKIKNYNSFIFEELEIKNPSKETEEEITKICKNWNIKNYTINSDGSVDVDGDVSLKYRLLKLEKKWFRSKLDKIPLKFGRVSGNFYCYGNNLTTLEGSPRYIGGEFDCSNNKLTSLVGGPEVVIKTYRANRNQINSFEGFPDDFESSVVFGDNPVQNILNQFPRNLWNRAIKLITDYDAIWNGEVVPERLEMVKDILEVPYNYVIPRSYNTSTGPR